MPGVHFISVPSRSVDRFPSHAPGVSAKPKSIQKVIKIYTNLLELDSGGRSQSCGRPLRHCKEVIMPIRISCRDKSLNRVQLLEYKEVNTLLASNPKASYMDRKTHFRILCGSI